MSRRSLYILGGLLLVVLVAGYWFMLLNPLRGEIAATTTQIEEEQQKLAVATAQLAKLQALEKQAASNQARLIELAKMMPAAKEVPSLIVQIQDLASESGIDFMTITPGQANATSAYATMPLNLQFSGTFFDINDFVYRVEQMVASPGRLLAVSSVTLGLGEDPPAETSPELDATLIIDAFQFVPTEPATAAPGAIAPGAAPAPGTPGSTNTAGGPASPAAVGTEQG